MTKYLLISIQPQHVYNILIGNKTRELRKKIPNWVWEAITKGETVKVLIYCTKAKDFLHKTQNDILNQYPKTPRFYLSPDPIVDGFDIINGYVVAQFELNKIRYVYESVDKQDEYGNAYEDIEIEEDFDIQKACITYKELSRYSHKGNIQVWAMYIENLKVFDNPKKLTDYYKNWYRGQFYTQTLTMAPQNMMQVLGDE
ncbi:hypothetical protein [Paracholeplasma manati]|uniref:hypothetical protein n=1 Tax=Paracholeplasma manati TaxID=591373 RepID=UPI0024085924|nr:hypothetical protein [Paracholeplasma manati]MDG0887878.1 hypothetical protein [Paracholeplasma manati]